MTWTRRTVLALAVATSACTPRDDPRSDVVLREDATLAATAAGTDLRLDALLRSGADACAASASVTPVANEAAERQALSLLQPAQEAAIAGDLERSRTLLRRAAALGSGKSEVAYLLARTSEAAGDTITALRQYCRFMALTPAAADSAEARGRLVALLEQVGPLHLAEAPSESQRPAVAPAPAARRRSSPVAGRRSYERRVYASQTYSVQGPAAVAASPSAAASSTASSSTASSSTASSSAASSGTASSSTATPSGPAPSAPTPSTDPAAVRPAAQQASLPAERPASQPEERRQTVRGAVIGAAAGAVVGAVVGEDVQGALIGAAAGGILGAAAGHAVKTRPYRTPGFARP